MITEEDVAREVHQLHSKFLGFFCTTGKLCSEPLCVSVSVSIICCLQVKKKKVWNTIPLKAQGKQRNPMYIISGGTSWLCIPNCSFDTNFNHLAMRTKRWVEKDWNVIKRKTLEPLRQHDLPGSTREATLDCVGHLTVYLSSYLPPAELWRTSWLFIPNCSFDTKATWMQ